RACHRPSQGRAPHGTQLSLVQARRCQQRRACRRRLQLPPSPPLAQALVAPNPDRTLRPAAAQSDLKTGIFTVDDVVACPRDSDSDPRIRRLVSRQGSDRLGLRLLLLVSRVTSAVGRLLPVFPCKRTSSEP